MNSNLAANLTATAARAGDRPALKLDDEVVDYAQLEDASARVAGLLRDCGCRPGDRIGVMLPNVPKFAAIYYGALRAGAVVVPMNVLLKEREVAYYLEDSQARLLLAWHEVRDAAQAGAADAGAECLEVDPAEFATLLAGLSPLSDLARRAPSDTAVLLYTSGTTGKPKGAELTHANLGANAEVVGRLLLMSEHDTTLGVLPLFHSFGQTCSLNATIAAGGCLALVPRFDAAVALETIERERVTMFQGVPTMLSAMLNAPGRATYDVSSLRMMVSGGASLPLEVLRACEAAFGCIVLEGYGLSETSPVACFNRPDRERKAGSIGLPIEGVEMKLVDGEICIRGHNVMKGYWRRPEATAEAIDADGWFKTGDVGRVDEDGYFFIVDRKKDLIIRGGYNVYPREIEEVLYEHPAVREAAVIGVPHDELGEEVAAVVALVDGEEASAAELRAWVKARVAAYKYPREVWLVEELPKGPTGKILKRDIVLPQPAEGP